MSIEILTLADDGISFELTRYGEIEIEAGDYCNSEGPNYAYLNNEDAKKLHEWLSRAIEECK
jgi:hypothetical protein